MSTLTIINAIANVIVVIACMDIAIRVFGRQDHPIHRYKVALITRKFVSSVVICGALLNVITLSTPSWTEVLLNVGFSINYCWSCFYDRIAHTKYPEVPRKVSKLDPKCRSGHFGQTKKNPAASGPGRKRIAT